MPDRGIVAIHAANVTIEEWEALPLKEGDYVKITIQGRWNRTRARGPPEIFDPYFMTKELGSQKGVGLGLTICYSIVRSHGGFITATSEVGSGTTVYVYLPAYQSETSRPSAESDGQWNVTGNSA